MISLTIHKLADIQGKDSAHPTPNIHLKKQDKPTHHHSKEMRTLN